MPRSIELTELERRKLADAGRQSIACTNGWRPIETAPKDGTHFLATSKHLKSEIFICRWGDMKHVHSTGTEHHIGWYLVGIPKRYYPGFGPLYMPINQDDLMPTHWQPLPKPPQEDLK